MKPLFYFAQCPQLEAIEALNWANGLSDKDRLITARIILQVLNLELIEATFNSIQNDTCSKSDMLLNAGDWASDRDLPIINKMIIALDGMPIEHCKGAIEYFNQF